MMVKSRHKSRHKCAPTSAYRVFVVHCSIGLTSDSLGCVFLDWNPRAVVDVVRAKVQRTHNHGVLVLAEVKGFPRLDTREKIRQKDHTKNTWYWETVSISGVQGRDVKTVSSPEKEQSILGVVAQSLTWCSGEQESSHTVGLGRRRTGLPLCFFDSSSR